MILKDAIKLAKQKEKEKKREIAKIKKREYVRKYRMKSYQKAKGL